MKCPKCEKMMERGSVVVEGTIGGFLFFGLSHQNLEFKGESGAEVVLPSNSRTVGYRCEACRLTLIEEETNLDQKAATIGSSLGTKYASWRHRS